ncbi:MAG: ubiquinone biosynthesis hydroxylase [Pseudomonadota bacterium]
MPAAKKKTSTAKAKMAPPDVIVAGAGYVGLAAAVTIAKGAPDLNILVVDAAPEKVWQKDGRASAIAAAASGMLDQIDCWQDLVPHAQPMTEMVITDSRTADPVRPIFLTFDGDVEDGQPFAHMIPNVELIRALRKQAEKLPVTIQQGTSIEDFTAQEGSVRVSLSDGTVEEAKLLIAADGVRSRLRAKAGIKTVSWDYKQAGIVAKVTHERDHGGQAIEHFLPAGPFAILPLKGNQSSIVWTESAANADRLLATDPLSFEVELERRFGHHLGQIKVEGQPRAYPLGLTLARDFVQPRFALAGDAAHGIHPIAGQGLNLGFKDVAALAEVIVDAHRTGQDIGMLDVLQRYERWRRFDTVQMGITTDVLNRLFSNDIMPLRAIRNIGLGLVDRMPPAKDFLIKQAAGLVGEAPRLLRGQPL